MTLRKLKLNDIGQVAKLHHAYLNQGILPTLGISFLEGFYKVLLSQENIITFVVVKDNTIVGFATTGTGIETLPKLVIKKLWKEVLTSVLKNPMLLLKMVQVPMYPGFKQKSAQNRPGEILFLAVDPKNRGQGIGKSLIGRCGKQLKAAGCRHFILSVRESMLDANSFYKNIGLKKLKVTKFLGENFVFWQGTC